MAEGPAVKIDMENRQCVSLQEILEAFSAPLNEEQTWAVCYQSAKFFQGSFKNKNYDVSLEFSQEALLLHKDGTCSLLIPKESSRNVACDEKKNERQAVYELGLTVYSALDYGITGDKERELSTSLEQLLEKMLGDEDGDEEENNNLEDEGIVDGHDFDEGSWEEENKSESSDICDSQDNLHVHRTLEDNQSPNGGISQSEEDDGKQSCSTFTQVLQVCSSHLPHPSQAASHYQAVVRALVAEVQELTTFLGKITSGSKNLQRLATDKIDGRGGCFEVTEVDLRELGIQEWARLWMQVIKDLRKEVQLKKVDATKRAPIEFELTPYEMLLDDIRSRRYLLKQVMVNGDIPPRVKKEAHDVILEFIRSRPPLKPVSERNLAPLIPPRKTHRELMLAEIKSEPRLKPAPRVQENKSKLCTNTDESHDPAKSPVTKKKITLADLNILDWDELDESYPEPEDDQTDGYQDDASSVDIAKDHVYPSTFDEISETKPSSYSTTERKYSLANFESLPSQAQAPLVGTPRRNSISICETPKVSMVSKKAYPQRVNYKCRSNHGRCLYSLPEDQVYLKQPKADGWDDPVEYLSLTIDEVKHIRSVLCKAELENLQTNKKVYLEVLNEKVCFNCKKRFALFNRKYKCKLCKRIICSRCCRRLKIPSDHFLHIPVQALSPSTSPSKRFESNFYFDEEVLRSESAPATPSCSPTMGRRSTWGRSASSSMKDVCSDCKNFMIQVLRTNKHATPRR